MRIYDVRGGLVRDLSAHAVPAGRHSISWDGRNSAGVPVRSGVYFMKANAGGKEFKLRLAVVR
jgi:flagellar hook assembly protein FlgD